MTVQSVRPLLFLDLDDVLCLNNPYGAYHLDKSPRPPDLWDRLFAEEPKKVLTKVHQAFANDGVRYVLSTSWRSHFSRAEFVEIFERTGLRFVAENLEVDERWRTPIPESGSDRFQDIDDWLSLHHQGEPFAVLDDYYSGWSLREAMIDPRHPIASRVLLCKEGVGLLPEHLKKIIEILRRPGSEAL